MTSTPAAIVTVQRLRDRLTAMSAAPAFDLAQLADVLTRLEGLRLTAKLLQVTLIGKAVNALRKRPHDLPADLVGRAKQLVRGWKQLLEPTAPAPAAASKATKRQATASSAGAAGSSGGKRKKGAASAGILAHGAVAQFYSKSRDADDLGCGRADWRRVLSNFYPVEIEVGGCKYASVEHAFHAAKARCSDKPSVAAAFEVGGSVPKDPLAAKRAGGRAGFKKLGATLNTARWDAARDAAVLAALRARYAVDALFRNILAASHAKRLYLLHFERGGAKSYWGGSIRKADGERVGTNRLGCMLMELAATSGAAG